MEQRGISALNGKADCLFVLSKGTDCMDLLAEAKKEWETARTHMYARDVSDHIAHMREYLEKAGKTPVDIGVAYAHIEEVLGAHKEGSGTIAAFFGGKT